MHQDPVPAWELEEAAGKVLGYFPEPVRDAVRRTILDGEKQGDVAQSLKTTVPALSGRIRYACARIRERFDAA